MYKKILALVEHFCNLLDNYSLSINYNYVTFEENFMQHLFLLLPYFLLIFVLHVLPG